MELNIQEIDNSSENPNIVILNDIQYPDDFSIKDKNIIEIKPTSTYDQILSKMGMYVENGKLTVVDNTKKVSFANTNINANKNNRNDCLVNKECTKIKCARLQQSIKQQQSIINPNTNPNTNPNPNPNQNSYIYNKYFKNQQNIDSDLKETIPLTKEQLIQKLLQNKIQRERIKQIKSTKLIMPTENIHFAPEQNFNRLFGFSQRK
jgi:DNA-directed RNA polymerase alpha subunit